MSKIWFITGASKGFGRILTEELLKRGDRVVATARKPETLSDLVAQYGDNILALPCDVTCEPQVQAAVAAALATFGRIDVLVQNAGYGVIGAVEEVSDAEVRAMFDVNIFGVLTVLRHALPSMRAQKSGHILMISSMGGLCTYPGSATYSATKHALEALGKGLGGELAEHGIAVTNIEPGPFRTDFAGGSLVIAEHQIHDYDNSAGLRRTRIKAMDGQQAGDPIRAAHAMIALTELDNPPVHLPMGDMAYEEIYLMLDALRDEIKAHEPLGRPTDYPADERGPHN